MRILARRMVTSVAAAGSESAAQPLNDTSALKLLLDTVKGEQALSATS